MASNATSDEVRTAFRRAVRRHHPDRGGDPKELTQAVEAFRELSQREPDFNALVFYRRRRVLAGFAKRWRRRQMRIAAVRRHSMESKRRKR